MTKLNISHTNWDDWKAASHEKLRSIGTWLKRRRDGEVPLMVYGAVSTATIWPVVEAALQSGQIANIVMTLMTVAGATGGSLLATQIEAWKNGAVPPTEDDLLQWVVDNVSTRTELVEGINAMLTEMDALEVACASVSEEDQAWFQETLQQELTQLKSEQTFAETINGWGTIIQDSHLEGGERSVVGSTAEGDIITGDHNQTGGVEIGTVEGDINGQVAGRDVVNDNQKTVDTGGGDYIENKIEQTFEAPASDPAETAFQTMKARYLRQLAQRCLSLPLAALSSDGDSGDEMTLDDVYIALDTTTRATQEGDRKSRRGGAGAELLALTQGEEDRILSALEAVTQDKKVVLLGSPGGGKSTFVRELVRRQALRCLSEKEELKLDAYFPLMINLRDLVPKLAGLTLEGISTEDQNAALVGVVEDHWRTVLGSVCGQAELATHLFTLLDLPQVLLVFDGLDEVASSVRPWVRQAVIAIAKSYPGSKRIIVTCRSRSYSDDTALSGFTAHTLANFDETKIGDFVTAWYRARGLSGHLSETEATERSADLKAAALAHSLRELSGNPMLLTTMAIIHQKRVRLPDQRVELYNEAVTILLSRWQAHLVSGLEISKELATVLRDQTLMRKSMDRLAYEVHRHQADAGEDANLSRAQMWVILASPAYLGDPGLADQFLDYVDQRAGLLVGHGGGEDDAEPALYTFPHRTFQEYLAGSYLVSRGKAGLSGRYWQLVRQGEFWAVPAQFGAEEMYFNQRNEEDVRALAYALCQVTEPQDADAWRAVLWSGQMALLFGVAKLATDTDNPEGGGVYVERLQGRLIEAMRGEVLAVLDRIEAGRILGKLGDPRPGVGVPIAGAVVGEAEDKAWGAVKGMQFCYVPAGPFWLGSDDSDELADDDEKPAQQLDIPVGYWMGRYPVTVAQYEAFVSAGGYAAESFWQEAQTHGYWENGQVKRQVYKNGGWTEDQASQAYDYGQPFNYPNHPIIGITWYEALAYSRWLTELLREKGTLPPTWEVRLPSEVAWEKAARGGEMVPKLNVMAGIRSIAYGKEVDAQLVANQDPKRRYPWGEKISANEAYFDQTEVNTTSAVGCFPAGKSPYGCEEMSGNVWEWCATVWQDSYADYKQRADLDAYSSRVLRGGSFFNVSPDVRCAARGGSEPDNVDNEFGFRLSVVPITSDL